MKIILEKFKEKMDTEISLLVKDAIEKLHNIDVQANESKKQVVRKLAKNFEGKIPTDTICMEITDQLRGEASSSFIRQCLDEKYKQRVRVENAKKQERKPQEELGFAPLPTLKREEELEAETVQETEKKEDIIIDTNDGISIEERDEPSITIDFSVMKDKTIVPNFYQQEHLLKEKTNHDLESSSGKEPVDENREDSLEKSSQIDIAYKRIATREEPAKMHDDMDKGILYFEFSMTCKELQNHMATLFLENGSDGKVWFNGKIDIKTEKVISSNVGRIEEQKQQDESLP